MLIYFLVALVIEGTVGTVRSPATPRVLLVFTSPAAQDECAEARKHFTDLPSPRMLSPTVELVRIDECRWMPPSREKTPRN